VRHNLAQQQGAVPCGLPSTTYGQQPAWAFAEQHKNSSGQYRDGNYANFATSFPLASIVLLCLIITILL
jgi:hypothetical protein